MYATSISCLLTPWLHCNSQVPDGPERRCRPCLSRWQNTRQRFLGGGPARGPHWDLVSTISVFCLRKNCVIHFQILPLVFKKKPLVCLEGVISEVVVCCLLCWVHNWPLVFPKTKNLFLTPASKIGATSVVMLGGESISLNENEQQENDGCQGPHTVPGASSGCWAIRGGWHVTHRLDFCLDKTRTYSLCASFFLGMLHC